MRFTLWLFVFSLLVLRSGVTSAEIANKRIHIFQSLYASEAEEIAREAIARSRKTKLQSTGKYRVENIEYSKILFLSSVMNTFEESQTLTLQIQLQPCVELQNKTNLKELISFHIPIPAYLQLFEANQSIDSITWKQNYANYSGSAVNTVSGRSISIRIESSLEKNQFGALVRKEINLKSKKGVLKEVSLRIWNLYEPQMGVGSMNYREVFYEKFHPLRKLKEGVLLCHKNEELGTLEDLNQINKASLKKTPGNFNRLLKHEELFRNAGNQTKIVGNKTK